VILRPHRAHRALHEARTLLRSERLELIALGGPYVERLLDEQRLVEEVRRRGDKRLLHPPTGQVCEGQERLDAGDATSGDDDAGGVRLSVHSSQRGAALCSAHRW